MFKKYWDIFGGILFGLIAALLVDFQLEYLQICYSVIILMLVSIGAFRIIKQSVEKSRAKKRSHNIIDTMVDSQKSVKAINIAQYPTKDGEVLGKLILNILGGLKNIMKKLKVFFDKFKGYILTFLLAALTAIEMCSGLINNLAGGVLTINGVEVLPIATLVLTAVIGIISNGWTKDQKEKIKALFAKSSTNELVQAEIKKTLKENEAKVKEFNKILSTKQTELDNLNSELESKNNTLAAKKEMKALTIPLATAEDIHLATIAVNEMKDKVEAKKQEIAEVEESISNLNTTISALKSQL